jgi:hypothetical protein
MDKPGLADLMIAPLSLLERSKGWKRRGLAFLYVVIALMLGVFGWGALSLWRLPDSPEPFDLAKYGRVEVPDADNAMVAYREVFARFGDLDAKSYKVASDKSWNVSDWSTADPEVHLWADDHRNALEAWLPTNDRTDSLLVQPEKQRMGTLLEQVQLIRPYVRLALLEGSRLEQAGDLGGAWRMYRAALRASRHAGRHAGIIPRLTGNAFLRQARPRIDAWIDRPGVTPELLRRAIGDVEACREMTSPASEMVRAEYFSARDTVNDTELWVKLSDSGPYSSTDWTNQFDGVQWSRRFLRREPERSARVLRLITAGYLAQCDRSRALRPKLLFADSMIYDHDAQTPQVVRSITPESLEAWYRDSVLNDLSPFSSIIQAYLDAEVGTFDHFRLRMAERAFEIERGRPPKTYGELLGPYLKSLPEGIEPEDLVNPGEG